jgi:hypothetical protein
MKKMFVIDEKKLSDLLDKLDSMMDDEDEEKNAQMFNEIFRNMPDGLINTIKANSMIVLSSYAVFGPSKQSQYLCIRS